jgi:hypothetical protein
VTPIFTGPKLRKLGETTIFGELMKAAVTILSSPMFIKTGCHGGGLDSPWTGETYRNNRNNDISKVTPARGILKHPFFIDELKPLNDLLMAISSDGFKLWRKMETWVQMQLHPTPPK